MHSSVVRRMPWDCSQIESQFEDGWCLEPTAEMPPAEEDLEPDAFLQTPATPVSFAGKAGGSRMSAELNDVFSFKSPELRVSQVLNDESESPAGSPQSSN